MSVPAIDPISFGTDGWRAQIAGDYTFYNVARVAQGLADYAKDAWNLAHPIVIGYDRRFGSARFAERFGQVLCANGIDCAITSDPTPTPAIAFAAGRLPAAGAVIITASHNPPADNGIKLRDGTGAALGPEQISAIEQNITRGAGDFRLISLSAAQSSGQLTYFDAAPDYLSQLTEHFDLEALAGTGRIVIDSMFGSGAGYLGRAFAQAGVEPDLIEVRSDHNPRFPGLVRPEPIPPHCQAGQDAVRGHAAAVGILNDGDADRLGIVDEQGRFVDQLRVMSLLAWGILQDPATAGPLVKTLTTSAMLNRLGQIYSQAVYETGVGMKFVAPKMVEVGAALGGEESGGYVIARHMPERDGIYSGLAFLQLMQRLDAKPTELVQQLFDLLGRRYHYSRIDIEFDPRRRAEILRSVDSWEPTSLIGQDVVARLSFDGYKYVLADGSWLLIRFSGTEPLLRIYGECPSEGELSEILRRGRQVTGA